MIETSKSNKIHTYERYDIWIYHYEVLIILIIQILMKTFMIVFQNADISLDILSLE